jgi:hypothetical protein
MSLSLDFEHKRTPYMSDSIASTKHALALFFGEGSQLTIVVMKHKNRSQISISAKNESRIRKMSLN